MAAGLIYGSLEPEYQTSVGGSVDAADMWKRLNQEHAQVAAANSNQLTAKFFQYIMNPDEQIEDRILSTLPPSFHGARAAWETLPSGEHRNLIRLTPMVITEEAIVEEDIEEEAIVEMVAKEEVADTEVTDEEKDIAEMEVTEEIIKEEEATIKDLSHHLVLLHFFIITPFLILRVERHPPFSRTYSH
ncbi:hypothetical protein DAPPUDRAFT_119704 [Daphnia pulex]|uniref:Uncharacterized protein n=1 Tax=Daphnia pulex TaxID=6669 RepID=E9HZ95_DAPPU|nr:hypothetical protein DAPPUDRAFT_119704 [Daphnia pulex]|eukprot:EFX62937.1 hypothetical protein DAPPUDRAFT_119704 [Daphnia pulex]